MKAELLEALKTIHKDPHVTCGICIQLEHLLAHVRDKEGWSSKIKALFAAWPRYSGNIDYPVPHPAKDPQQAYNETENMWNRRTKYGQARWDLLEFCISELEKELSNEQY